MLQAADLISLFLFANKYRCHALGDDSYLSFEEGEVLFSDRFNGKVKVLDR